MTFNTVTPFAPTTPAVSRIGRFYLTRELGRGSLGCVYLGHDPVIARDVAIKTFNPRLTPGERIRYEHQFINEARAAGRLSHPHIITIYDASSEGGTTYVAMEYLQGRELSKVLESGHRFKPDEVASIAWKLADAVNHAHENQVIHRDIKPANIFMLKNDQPKLVDFGIARSPNRVAEKNAKGDGPYTIFHGNNLVGTPNYMSPEQALGKTLDERTDIYSLGAVMYEMLTSRKPFHAENTDKLLQQIAFKAPPAPHEIDSQVPQALSEIVMKAMSKRPEKRYQDAGKMAVDIKHYLLRERRARRRTRIALLPTEQALETEGHLHRRRMLWFGWAALAAAALAAGVSLVR
jgi:serine/threonine-protein kinase